MSSIRNPVTRDIIGPLVRIPKGCITASDLHALAATIERLHGFHTNKGGQAPDEPCLVEVLVENDKHVHARVHSGKQVYRLKLVEGVWEFQ